MEEPVQIVLKSYERDCERDLRYQWAAFGIKSISNGENPSRMTGRLISCFQTLLSARVIWFTVGVPFVGIMGHQLYQVYWFNQGLKTRTILLFDCPTIGKCSKNIIHPLLFITDCMNFKKASVIKVISEKRPFLIFFFPKIFKNVRYKGYCLL